MLLKNVSSSCPAFSSGCPYASITTSEGLKAVTARCPKFNEGCPFSKVEQTDTIEKLLATIPPSHLDNTDIAQAVSGAFQQVHQVSATLKTEVGQCPLFTSECIFKQKCLNLQPLIDELDLRTWGIYIKEINSTDNFIHLAKELKFGTQESHRAAERVDFVRSFLKGRIEKAIYANYLGCLYWIYKALEEEARNNASHPLFSFVHYPKELEREESLEADLEYFFGPGWKEQVLPLSDVPAVKDYVDRIHHIGQNDPPLLISHTYTRYMGDLSGGQVLKRVAEKTYQLPPSGEGTQFYLFHSLPTKSEHVEFKNKYRSQLDSISVTEELASAIVVEANRAFSLNTTLFLYLDSLTGFKSEVVPQTPSAKCPFATLATNVAKPHAQPTEPSGESIGYKIHRKIKPFYPYLNPYILLALLVVLLAFFWLF